ncbi:hypothetical protein [Pseudomonas sp. TE3-3-F2023]
MQPVKPENLAEQQRFADAFYREGLSPRAVDAKAVSLYEPVAD